MKKTGLIFYFVLISILLVGIGNPAFANKDKLPGSIRSIDSNGLSEANAYRMLYDNQVKSNDAILKTIFYALGGLATALVLVFASNWWFNEKKVLDIRAGINAQINDAKRAALNEVGVRIGALAAEKTAQISELQIKLQAEITASIADITSRFNEFHEKIRAEIKEDNKTLLSNYQIQLQSFNENYRQQVSTLNENIKNQADNVKDKIHGTEKTLKHLISTEVNSLEQRIARNEFYMWSQGGIMSNALMAQIEELELLLKHPNEYTDYDFYLKQLAETVKDLSHISETLKTDAIAAIKKVPDKYNHNKNELLKKLQKMKSD